MDDGLVQLKHDLQVSVEVLQVFYHTSEEWGIGNHFNEPRLRRDTRSGRNCVWNRAKTDEKLIRGAGSLL